MIEEVRCKSRIRDQTDRPGRSYFQRYMLPKIFNDEIEISKIFVFINDADNLNLIPLKGEYIDKLA